MVRYYLFFGIFEQKKLKSFGKKNIFLGNNQKFCSKIIEIFDTKNGILGQKNENGHFCQESKY